MKLKDALGIRPGEVASLVGGGGKTSIMFALAKELAAAGGCVVTTTTTKIFEPLPAETPLVIVEKDEEELVNQFLKSVPVYRHITLAAERLTSSGKLAGISPGLVERLAGMKAVSHIIVEADGAAQRPLKAPNATEPVIPGNTSLVITVVGVDAVGCSLTETEVFRAGIAAKLLGLPLGSPLSLAAIAKLITHRQGITKGSPEKARIIPFINKVDRGGGLVQGRELAREILAVGHPGIKYVLLGQARLAEPVVEVISEGGAG